MSHLPSQVFASLRRYRLTVLLTLAYSLVAGYFVYFFYASHEQNDGIIILALLTMPIEFLVVPLISPNWSAYSQAAITAIAGTLQYLALGLFFDIRRNKSQ